MPISTAPILLVHQTPTKSAPLMNHLVSQKIPTIAASNFTEIEGMNATKCYSLILCDWEFFQSQQDNPQQTDAVNELFKSSLPVIFFSALQTASVKFRQVNSRSVYSMKTADIPSVFDAICELAKQVEKPPLNQPLKGATKEKRLSNVREPAPHFTPLLVLDAANANSCIHGLY